MNVASPPHQMLVRICLHGREQSGPVRAGRGLSEYPEGITPPQDFKGPQEQPHFVMRILPQFARVIVTWNLGHCAVYPRFDLASAERSEG
jgi:hypothetical protein